MARQDDGHATKISFAADTTILLWEKEVTPPGVSGGGANDTTTMHNVDWRTFKPKKLKTMTSMSFTAAYDPAVYDEIVALANVNTQVTVTFPDTSTIVFWGWLDEFTPGTNTEGEQPTASVTVAISNEDNASPPVEQAPVYAA